jgi:hypothetical protein
MIPKSRGVVDMKPVAWNGGFNDTAGIAFSGRQMTKCCSSEAMYSSAKGLMTLEEIHCQATKRPN